MDTKELNDKSIAELGKTLNDLLKEQFNLRMQNGSGQLAQTHLVKEVRRSIAQVRTLINMKNRAEKS
tara:strand:+ start:187 stop:387 length:201 start_codon:yes stop_codon:yes gene_type:complete